MHEVDNERMPADPLDWSGDDTHGFRRSREKGLLLFIRHTSDDHAEEKHAEPRHDADMVCHMKCRDRKSRSRLKSRDKDPRCLEHAVVIRYGTSKDKEYEKYRKKEHRAPAAFSRPGLLLFDFIEDRKEEHADGQKVQDIKIDRASQIQEMVCRHGADRKEDRDNAELDGPSEIILGKLAADTGDHYETAEEKRMDESPEDLVVRFDARKDVVAEDIAEVIGRMLPDHDAHGQAPYEIEFKSSALSFQ